MSDTENRTGNAGVWQSMMDKVQGQVWPQSCLYVVATPIGNMGDLSLRGWQALELCDIIAAEDTRATRPFLQAWGIQTPLMAAHRHNEAQAAQAIIERLEQGQRVALVSDAGAPAVSDPGARVVRSVREAGFQVIPLPGASAVITALMGSGATSDENPAFAFAGFMPPKTVARRKWLQHWSSLGMPVLMFESIRENLEHIFPGADCAAVLTELQAIHDRVLKSRVFVALHMHAGDGNVHTNIPVNSDDYGMLQQANVTVARIMQIARGLDGVISGEHGIGLTKYEFLTQEELDRSAC